MTFLSFRSKLTGYYVDVSVVRLMIRGSLLNKIVDVSTTLRIEQESVSIIFRVRLVKMSLFKPAVVNYP